MWNVWFRQILRSLNWQIIAFSLDSSMIYYMPIKFQENQKVYSNT